MSEIVNGFTGNEGRDEHAARRKSRPQVGSGRFAGAIRESRATASGDCRFSGSPAELPGVPRGDGLTPKDERGREMLTLLQALSEMGRLTAGNRPIFRRPILATERQALTAMMKDPSFLADAKKLKPADRLSSRQCGRG